MYHGAYGHSLERRTWLLERSGERHEDRPFGGGGIGGGLGCSSRRKS